MITWPQLFTTFQGRLTFRVRHMAFSNNIFLIPLASTGVSLHFCSFSASYAAINRAQDKRSTHVARKAPLFLLFIHHHRCIQPPDLPLAPHTNIDIFWKTSQSLAEHASMHRSPDGFRGRARLVSSLVALQTVLAAAAAAASPRQRMLFSNGNDDDDTAAANMSKTQSITASSRQQQQQHRGDGGFAGPISSAVGAAFGCSPDGEEAGSGNSRWNRRLSWVLRLACHRDATVRALSFGVLAETIGRLSLPSPHRPSSSFSRPHGASSVAEEMIRESGSGLELPTGAADGIEGGRAPISAAHGHLAPPTQRPTADGREGAQAGEEAVQPEDDESDDAEAVRVCVRAALDGHYESPAVVAEALRFLCRHATTRLSIGLALVYHSSRVLVLLACWKSPRDSHPALN